MPKARSGVIPPQLASSHGEGNQAPESSSGANRANSVPEGHRLALAAALGSVESTRGGSSRRKKGSKGKKSSAAASGPSDPARDDGGSMAKGGVPGGLAAGIAAAAGARSRRVETSGDVLSPRATAAAAAAATRAKGGKLAAALRERQANLKHIDSDGLDKANAAAKQTAAASGVG